MPNIYDDPRTYVTPGVLSTEAKDFVRLQRASGRRVFVRAYPSQLGAKCQNCQDNQAIVIVPIQSGPHQYLDGSLATWFDGDEESGPGWYIVHRTKKETFGADGKMIVTWHGSPSFLCPVCQHEAVADAAPKPPDWSDW